MVRVGFEFFFFVSSEITNTLHLRKYIFTRCFNGYIHVYRVVNRSTTPSILFIFFFFFFFSSFIFTQGNLRSTTIANISHSFLSQSFYLKLKKEISLTNLMSHWIFESLKITRDAKLLWIKLLNNVNNLKIVL